MKRPVFGVTRDWVAADEFYAGEEDQTVVVEEVPEGLVFADGLWHRIRAHNAYDHPGYWAVCGPTVSVGDARTRIGDPDCPTCAAAEPVTGPVQ